VSGQGAGGAGNGGSGSGRSLLTRSLQVFSESPPVVGYGGWTGISRLGAPPPQQQHVRQIGGVVQPQHTVSSDEEQQQTDQREEQDEEDFGGFLSSSLPAFHLGFSFAQPLAATTTATTTASPFSRHVRRMSLDQTLSGDGSAGSERQRPLPPKVPESTLVSHSVCTRRVGLNDMYFNHQGKRRAEEPLVDSLARGDPPKSAFATQQQQQPFVQLSTSLPPLATFPSGNGSTGFVPALPCTTETSYPTTPFGFSFDRRSQQQQLQQQQQCIDGGIGSFAQLPFDELSPPTSARPSTAGGTQDLVAAAQAAVDEVAGRFAPYAESGVPFFGRDSAPFGGLNPSNLSGVAVVNVLPFQSGFDTTTTASASASASVAASAAGAGAEIGGLVGIPTKWGSGAAFAHIPQAGSVGSRNGSGGTASPDTTSSGTSTIYASARRIRLGSSVAAAHAIGMRPHHRHRTYSPTEERKHEHGNARRCYCRVQVVRIRGATVVAAVSGGPGSVSTGGEG